MLLHIISSVSYEKIIRVVDFTIIGFANGETTQR